MNAPLHPATVSDANSFDELVDNLTTLLQVGEPINLDDIDARYPQYANRLREIWPTLRALSRIDSAEPGNPASPLPDSLRQLGDFRLVRELGRGGMGVVFEAQQLSLQRRVALKILPQACLFDERRRKRFHNEARVAAGLRHPHIVPIFQVGIEAGIDFFAMQLIEGQSWAELIRRRQQVLQRTEYISISSGTTCQGQDDTDSLSGEPTRHSRATDPWHRSTDDWNRQVAQWGIQIAAALHDAHRAGIIHRDVKPSNILVDGKGSAWLTDFGLAQILDDETLTMTGAVVGTLRYMSPEQSRGDRTAIDHRADIYGLGAALYELLTLRPVHDASDRVELLKQVVQHEIIRPRHCDQSIPRELDLVIMKSLSASPQDRYATAAEFAEDLENVVAGRPVRAVAGHRSGKWTLRQRLALIGLACIVISAAIMGASEWQGFSLDAPREQELQERASVQKIADAVGNRARQQEYAANIVAAATGWREGIAADEIRRRLEQCIPAADEGDLRGLEWHLLNELLPTAPVEIGRHEGMAYYVDVSSDRQHIATAGQDGIRIWNAFSGKQITFLPIPPPATGSSRSRDYNEVRFSADGRYLVGASDDGHARVWDCRDWSVVREFPHVGAVISADFHSTGRQIVTAERTYGDGGRDFGACVVRAWSWPKGEFLREMQRPSPIPDVTRQIQAMAVAPNGSWVATVDGNNMAYIWELDSGQLVHQWKNPVAASLSWSAFQFVRFSPDSKYLVACVSSSALLVGQIGSDEFRETVHTPLGWSIQSVAFSPDGTQLAAVSRNSRLALFDVTGDCRLRFANRRLMDVDYSSVAFLNDQNLVTTDRRGIVSRWPLDDMRFGYTPSETIERWSTAEGSNLVIPPPWRDEFGPVTNWPAGQELPGVGRIILADDASSFMWHDEVWNTQEPIRTPFGTFSDYRPPLRLLSTGEWLATRADNEIGALVSYGQQQPFYFDSEAIQGSSPDGDWIATLQSGSEVVLRKGRPPQRQRVIPHVKRFVFSPRGTVCAGIGTQGTVLLWDSPEAETPSVIIDQSVSAICFSPDGTRLAGFADGFVKLWLVATGTELLRLATPFERIYYLRFSPDGQALACCGQRADGSYAVIKWSAGSQR